MANLIRYRSAVLLIGAALALVTNPVWHAVGHLVSDHASEHMEHVLDVRWAEDDLCPYCDAVSQVSDTPTTAIHHAQLIPVEDIVPVEGHYADLSLLQSARLRAPPILA